VPNKNKRGTIAGTNKEGDQCMIMFRGNVEDLFKVKEFLEEKDKEEGGYVEKPR
jgi:hypothetical protein